MARSLLIFIFLFFSVLPVYAGKPTLPSDAHALPASDVTSNSAKLGCSVIAGSQPNVIVFYRQFPLPNIGIYNSYPDFVLPASTSPADYYWVWSGLLPNTYYEYYCSGNSTEGSSWSDNVISFTTLPSFSFPPTCTLSVNPVSILPGASSVLSFSSTNSTSFDISNFGSVTPNVSGFVPVSPSVTTTYVGTVIGNGSNTCSATLTVGALPISNTLGATTSLFYPNAFEVQCSNMYGVSPTRLFLRLTSGGVSVDYTYIEVPDVSTYIEFYPVTVSTYNLYIPPAYLSYYIVPVTLQQYLVNLTFLNPNTLYQYQCCSENSYGVSCGDTAGPGGSIYTPSDISTFDYNFNPSWPHLASYGRSIWSISINLPAECLKRYLSRIEIVGSVGGVIQPVGGYDLVYDLTGDGIPERSSCSNFSVWDLNHNGYLDAGDNYNYWNSCNDAYRWDTNKDGILDLIDVGSGNPICGVVYISGHEHFFTCPVGVSIGKPVFAVVDVGADGVGCLPKNVVGSAVLIPFGNAYFAADAQGRGKSGQSRGRSGVSIGKSSNRRGVVGEIFR